MPYLGRRMARKEGAHSFRGKFLHDLSLSLSLSLILPLSPSLSLCPSLSLSLSLSPSLFLCLSHPLMAVKTRNARSC